MSHFEYLIFCLRPASFVLFFLFLVKVDLGRREVVGAFWFEECKVIDAEVEADVAGGGTVLFSGGSCGFGGRFVAAVLGEEDV